MDTQIPRAIPASITSPKGRAICADIPPRPEGVGHLGPKIMNIVFRRPSKQQCRSRFLRLSGSLVMALVVTVLVAACSNPIGSQTELSGHLLVAGSTALLPLAAQAAPLFDKEHPKVRIDVQGGGSLVGLSSVTTNKADIGDSDLYADPAMYPDPNLTDHIVCVVPFTMIANPDIPVKSLTQQQVIDIFSTGKIRNWNQVGGPDLSIVPVVRPTTSGTRATFRKYVLAGRDEGGPIKLLHTDSSATVRDTVAQTPGAIGYLALSVLTPSVNSIGIDGHQATEQNIAAGTYSFWSYEHMYTMGDSSLVLKSFLDFMLTPTVQQLAQRLSYIPISEMKIPSVGSTSGNTSPPPVMLVLVEESEATRHGS
jgi:phosphate transport system substrate-binding protein